MNELKDKRKEEIESGFALVSELFRDSLNELVLHLFPQVDSVCGKYGGSHYGHETESVWNKELRVCSPNNFDSYFTLIPGGDESELSNYETSIILKSMESVEGFENKLRDYLREGKLRKVLDKIQNFTDDKDKIPAKFELNVVQSLFNISDVLPDEKIGMWDFGADMEMVRIVYQILSRNTNKEDNSKTLEAAIKNSKCVSGPIQSVSIITGDEDKNKEKDIVIPEDKIDHLKKLCIERIEAEEYFKLLDNKNLIYILYRWKKWDNSEKLGKFIEKVCKKRKDFILFLSKLITSVQSQSMGDYRVKLKKKINFNDVSAFIELDWLNKKLAKIVKDKGLTEDERKVVEFFISEYKTKDKVDF
jgi:hypothetical protein